VLTAGSNNSFKNLQRVQLASDFSPVYFSKQNTIFQLGFAAPCACTKMGKVESSGLSKPIEAVDKKHIPFLFKLIKRSHHLKTFEHKFLYIQM
jgi:hypothetical protein